MPISTQLSTDYTDRTIDLEIWQTAKQPSFLVPLTSTINRNATTRKVTGIQKLCQRYLVLVLSVRETTTHDDNNGTRFLKDTPIGGTYTKEQLLHTFTFANTAAVAQLRAEDENTVLGVPPDDERIQEARLLNYSVDTFGRVFIRVRLVSRAGDVVTFVVPIS